MAIDFILDYGCEPKKLLGLGGVLDGSKVRQQVAQMRQLHEDGRVPDGEPITIVRITPDGTLDSESLTPRELEARAAGYDMHAGHCRGCPANVLERTMRSEHVFGCHGMINYPLSHELEFLLYVTLRFVGDRLMDAPASRLVHFILETGVSGEAAHSARQGKPEHGAPFTARSEGLSHVIGGPAGDVSIDTDQLLEALFFGSKIEPQVAQFLYVPFFETMEQMIGVLMQERPRDAGRLADRSVVQLRQFGAAVKIAAELGSNVIIDL